MVDRTLEQMGLGFRSVYWQEVDLDNPTFVVGQNGSGKSNFADAFAFLSEAMSSPLQAVIRAAWRVFCSIPSQLAKRTSGESDPASEPEKAGQRDRCCLLRHRSAPAEGQSLRGRR